MNSGHKIYYHKIGTPQSEDVLFYQNAAYPMRFYYASVNEKETLMYLYESGAGAGNNLFVRDLRQPESQFIQMTSDMDYQYSPVYDDGDRLWLYTNYGAPKGHIMTADIRQPGVDNWQELIPEQENVLGDVDVINRQLFLTYQKDASDHAYLYGLDGKLRHEVRLPSVGSVGFTGDEKEPECFYTFTSFTIPGTIYRYDMEKDESTLYSSPKVKFRQDDYTSEQVFFNSKDGTRIPMFLTYKKGLKKNGKNPVYLYGYGGFNISLGPSFSATRIPFLENGGIYAQVDSKDIVDSVNRGFLMSGKVVDRGLMLGVCELFQNNIYYINFFASLCDALSKGYIMEPVLNEALADMVAIHEPRFRAIMADLTTFQVSLLRAILDGHTRFSSAEVIRRYDLNSSANVRRLKDALCKKEIITFDSDDNPQLLDPLFEYWVTKYYFEIQ